MMSKRFTIVTHTLVWLILVVIPYISTDQIFNFLDPSSNPQYLLLCFSLSGVLLSLFYFHYLVLIPKYLLTKRYWTYFLFLLLAVAAVLFLAAIIFFYSEFNPEAISKTNPAIEKIIPVIIINAGSLWLLTVFSSILWAAYNRIQQVEREKLTAQIASLKSQINPHFLFNTLNNIYATAIEGSPRAADMVDKLSEMMRYTMKEIQQDYVSLEDEINYIENYIELQKNRLDKSVQLEYHVECVTTDNISSLRIAPMMLIPFIENAFKHGVNSEQKSRIKIEIEINNSEIHLSVVNNKVTVQRDISERSGLGIENTKHRLNLMYPAKHLLVIDNGKKEFSVSLHINLQ